MMLHFFSDFFDFSTIRRYEWRYFAIAFVILGLGVLHKCDLIAAGPVALGFYAYGVGCVMLAWAALLLGIVGPETITLYTKAEQDDNV